MTVDAAVPGHECGRRPLTTVRRFALVLILLAVASALGACGGPALSPSPGGSTGPSAPAVATSTAPVSPEPTPEPALAYARKTCDLFRQMVEGVNTLSTKQQQKLVDQMADAVQYTGNVELMRGVVDLGEGYLQKDPQRFARGMRKLSAECDVPYK
jgi:hypothetical protein